MTLKHATQTAIADDPAYDVGANEWNADHVVTGPDFGILWNSGSGVVAAISGLAWNDTSKSLNATGTDAEFSTFGHGGFTNHEISYPTPNNYMSQYVVSGQGFIEAFGYDLVFLAGVGGADGGTDHNIIFYVEGGATRPLYLSYTGNALAGIGSLTVNSTDGFLHIPSAAGVSVATPSTASGYVPIYYDRTNNKLMAYNGAWKGVTLA